MKRDFIIIVGSIIRQPVSYTHLDVYKRQVDLFLTEQEYDQSGQQRHQYNCTDQIVFASKRSGEGIQGGCYHTESCLLYTSGEVVASMPVLDDLPDGYQVAVENSAIVYDDGEGTVSTIVCNWFGAGNAGLSDLFSKRGGWGYLLSV